MLKLLSTLSGILNESYSRMAFNELWALSSIEHPDGNVIYSLQHNPLRKTELDYTFYFKNELPIGTPKRRRLSSSSIVLPFIYYITYSHFLLSNNLSMTSLSYIHYTPELNGTKDSYVSKFSKCILCLQLCNMSRLFLLENTITAHEINIWFSKMLEKKILSKFSCLLQMFPAFFVFHRAICS